jgi:EAL domain-containing protein (putative c-di-GMP-specific phosphodiesterase class I)
VSAKLRDALAKDQLFVAMQPVVDLVNRRVFAHEALLRSRTPELKGPLTIIESAIANDFMGTLGRALRDMAVLACPETPLFLNVNPAEFDEGWLVRPDDPIFRHDHPVYLEITESVPLSHFRHCHTVLKEIRSKGVFLAVDDLGAGYSNLKYIADLAPEIVKLDRELVAGLHKEPRQFRLVRSIVRLCDDMGAKVVAEGIETVEELKAVVDSGTHFGQGYLLARPAMPLPEVNWAALDKVAGGSGPVQLPGARAGTSSRTPTPRPPTRGPGGGTGAGGNGGGAA